ncbi:glycoside hydrolase family 3 N-terminal domain-containing protein [Paenibacillus yanchengensis]|uniref:Glycoside hydrolase family 3 N-terminal domain-containing protein n=1 Tax=Paenibacillus yanchengensis TaxID=2035833 RepID=A0ABW4YL96_9BACL
MERYKQKEAPIQERVEDLLARMTLEEKVGQLNQKMYGWNAYKKVGKDEFKLTDAFEEEVNKWGGMGALYGLFRADPWSQVTYENGINARNSAKMANAVQRYMIENTRLGIPVLLSEETPHGHQALDGTLIPTNIGTGSTWNPKLAEQAYEQIAAEIRSRGAHLGLISTLDILRDPRWGRSEECFSEDPYLAAQFTTAAVNGLQGELQERQLADGTSDSDGYLPNDRIAAVLKHFSGQGSGQGGINAFPAPIGERELRDIHLPGMEAGTKAGALGCMAAYNEIDGVPCHANKKLLTDILRDEWGYEGIVMADGVAIDRLQTMAPSYEGAAALALTAGVDLSLWDTAFTTLDQAVHQNKVSMDYIDRAVRRILALKFRLGLFDNPYTSEEQYEATASKSTLHELNVQLARESAVLVKNEQQTLPIASSVKKIAVIGPNANNIYHQLGDYTAIQAEESGTTILQGIKQIAGNQFDVNYAPGCTVRGAATAEFDEAVTLASKSDLAVLVMGGSSARNFELQFDTNGAVISDSAPPEDMDCGEGVDLADLSLGGVQTDLIKAIAATGTKVVLVLIQGRPHAIADVEPYCSAILVGWYPGPEGGKAIGEMLFGEVNPSGKLTVTMPVSASVLPVYYNLKDQHRVLKYFNSQKAILYPFGYGLSYTTFAYSHLQVEKAELSVAELEAGNNFRVSIDVTNSGNYAGAEVVQLYTKDMEGSVTRRVKELKGFEKVWLEPGETKTVTFTIAAEHLKIWNIDMQHIIEPGNVNLMVGSNSLIEDGIMVTIL